MSTHTLLPIQVKDPCIGYSPKGSFGTIDPEGSHETSCVSCGKELRFNAVLCGCTLLAAACNDKCAADFEWPNLPQYVPVEKAPVHHREPCPDCGGEPQGRGWDHLPVKGYPCPRSVAGKEAAAKAAGKYDVCPQCQGRKRYGKFEHEPVGGETCPAQLAEEAARKAQQAEKAAAKPVRPPCPHCGGPAGRARGWVHKAMPDGAACPNSPQGKLAAKKAAMPRAAATPGRGRPAKVLHRPDDDLIPEPVVVESQPVAKPAKLPAKTKRGKAPRGRFEE